VLSTNRKKSFFINVLILVAFILPFALTRSSVALAQTPVAYEEVGIIETDDLDLLNPTGLAFSPADNTFFVLPAHPAPLQPQGTTTIVSTTPFADLVGTVSVPAAGVDPLNMAFDRQANRLLLFDAATNDLVEIKVLQSSPLSRRSRLACNIPKGWLSILRGAYLSWIRLAPDWCASSQTRLLAWTAPQPSNKARFPR